MSATETRTEYPPFLFIPIQMKDAFFCQSYESRLHQLMNFILSLDSLLVFEYLPISNVQIWKTAFSLLFFCRSSKYKGHLVHSKRRIHVRYASDYLIFRLQERKTNVRSSSLS